MKQPLNLQLFAHHIFDEGHRQGGVERLVARAHHSPARAGDLDGLSQRLRGARRFQCEVHTVAR